MEIRLNAYDVRDALSEYIDRRYGIKVAQDYPTITVVQTTWNVTTQKHVRPKTLSYSIDDNTEISFEIESVDT